MSTIESTPLSESVQMAGELSASAIYDKCWTLAKNLWWTWHPEVISIFRDLDPIRWRLLTHAPTIAPPPPPAGCDAHPLEPPKNWGPRSRFSTTTC